MGFILDCCWRTSEIALQVERALSHSKQEEDKAGGPPQMLNSSHWKWEVLSKSRPGMTASSLLWGAGDQMSSSFCKSQLLISKSVLFDHQGRSLHKSWNARWDEQGADSSRDLVAACKHSPNSGPSRPAQGPPELLLSCFREGSA